MSYRHCATLVLVLASAACASSGTASSADGATPSTSTTRANRNVLTQEELRAGPHATMLDAVTALRPQWLRNNGVTSLGGSAGSGLTIYVDGSAFGGPDAMRNLDVRTVARARYLSVAEAQNRYGLRAGTPVIDIELLH